MGRAAVKGVGDINKAMAASKATVHFKKVDQLLRKHGEWSGEWQQQQGWGHVQYCMYDVVVGLT